MSTRTKKENLARFHRETIQTTAKALFLEKGVTGTTMDDVARAADYSKSTVYVYFKSKDDILYHIIRDGMAGFETAITERLAERRSFREFYLSMYEQLVAMHAADPVVFEGLAGFIHIHPADGIDDAVIRDIYDIGERIIDHLTAEFERGIAEGAVSGDIVPLDAVFTMWFALCGIIEKTYAKTDYITQRTGKSPDAFMRTAFDTLLRSLLPVRGASLSPLARGIVRK